ncbi:polyhydroxyalkanoate biosynthesis repressor PhaR [Viridibacillus sp. YIM B01967]|uniref:Polyhydroxyalkanoate biosynthesis repressor PhaR n=1 Tax=Viridibacillus soli TaxID=2798301 RepID=A0ABS1H501_9BACL|nr:polyhydroxyalkanoate biosynthesis repressor PhaR [Viridibacillus soli]MBK3494133.1 polyhydroxyalkanoate biosynthesis repressor PhaR [Viridibacillus soli]
MTQKTPFEPFTMWKDMYEKTEKAWHDVIQDTLGKESFSEGLGQIQYSYLQYHELVNNLTEAYFKQANIPTRDEIANVASLVINLEGKIDNMDDQLYENSETMNKDINQLKRTVSNLDKKFDKVLEALATLEKKIQTGDAMVVTETANIQPEAKSATQSTQVKPATDTKK